MVELGKGRGRIEGFTLLELLIVIAILAILAAAMMPIFQTSRIEAQIAKVRSDLDVIKNAALRFRIDTGKTVHVLSDGNGTNVDDPYCLADTTNTLLLDGYTCGDLTNWRGPYLTWVEDPWGTHYRICGVATTRIAHSNGPNRVSEACGGDDICSYIYTQTP